MWDLPQIFKKSRNFFEIVILDDFEVNMMGKIRKFLIMVDLYSYFFEIEELKDLLTKMTILICKKVFSGYGIPKQIISDNATNFLSLEFEEFEKSWNFKQTTSSPRIILPVSLSSESKNIIRYTVGCRFFTAFDYCNKKRFLLKKLTWAQNKHKSNDEMLRLCSYKIFTFLLSNPLPF